MIPVREALSTGAESLRHHALRSFLAMLGIIFGVGAVIAMLSIGAGAEQEALALIDAMGVRNMIVRAKDPERENDRQEIRQKSPGLATRDAIAIREAVPGVETVVRRGAGGDLEGAVGERPCETRGARGLRRLSAARRAVPLREGRFFDRARRRDLRRGRASSAPRRGATCSGSSPRWAAPSRSTTSGSP